MRATKSFQPSPDRLEGGVTWVGFCAPPLAAVSDLGGRRSVVYERQRPAPAAAFLVAHSCCIQCAVETLPSHAPHLPPARLPNPPPSTRPPYSPVLSLFPPVCLPPLPVVMVSPSGRLPAAAFVASPTAGLSAHRGAFAGTSVAGTCRPRVASVVDRRVRVTAAAAGPSASGRVHVVQPAADVSHLVGGDKTLTRGVEQAPATVGTPALPLPGRGYGMGAVFMALAGAAALFNRKPKKEASGDGVTQPEVVTSMAASANGAAASPNRTLGQKLKDMIPTPQERKKLGPLALMFFVILFNYVRIRVELQGMQSDRLTLGLGPVWRAPTLVSCVLGLRLDGARVATFSY